MKIFMSAEQIAEAKRLAEEWLSHLDFRLAQPPLNIIIQMFPIPIVQWIVPRPQADIPHLGSYRLREELAWVGWSILAFAGEQLGAKTRLAGVSWNRLNSQDQVTTMGYKRGL